MKRTGEALVSIVVPVYNSQTYLERCIQSILSQTYEKIELIMIDDGSTDHSRNIIRRYEKKDKRIRYIYQNNQGVASARNRGIKFANGEYLLFVDSDDDIAPDMIAEMYKEYTTWQCDLVICGMIVRTAKHGKKRILSKNGGKICSAPYNSKQITELYNNRLLFAIGTKLYRSDIIKRHSISFHNQHYLEDITFCMEYLKYCQMFYVMKKAFYFYDLVSENSLNKQNQLTDQMETVLSHLKYLYFWFRTNSQVTSVYQEIALERILTELKGIYRKNRYFLPKVYKNIRKVFFFMQQYDIHSKHIGRQLTRQEERIATSLEKRKAGNLLMLLIIYN